MGYIVIWCITVVKGLSEGDVPLLERDSLTEQIGAVGSLAFSDVGDRSVHPFPSFARSRHVSGPER